MKRILWALVLGYAVSGFGLSFWGKWDLTLELMPNLRVYSSTLTLNCSFIPGWRVESESKIYSDGLLRYQNFYIDGSFGDFDVWGKIYFHAQEVRYQKMWVNAEIPVGAGTFRASFNHWATSADYSSSDKDMFGPWPCVPEVPVVSWDEAWKFMEQEVMVTGQVASASRSGTGPVYINIGTAYPDPYRFQIYIPSANVPAFESKFGQGFWNTWNTEKPVICVRGKIKGYRYTSGGPRDEGYSVAEVSITDPSMLSLGACSGTIVSASCPGTVIRWWEAHMHDGETLYIQGPVASITGPAAYYGYGNHYRVRIGGGSEANNRVEVIMPSHPGWSTVGSSYYDEVCVCGKITVIDGVAVILPPDLISTSGDPCCQQFTILQPYINWRYTFTYSPFKITVDFSDCCEGTWFRQAKVELSDVSLCCGLFLDASLTFTKAAGLEKLTFSLGDFYLPCCGITATVSAEFTPTSKTVKFEPKWRGLSGCFTVYGDVKWTPNVIQGIEVYGFGITCYTGNVKLNAITAFDPDMVEDMTDITFYTGEWEYFGLTYTGQGCCGGDLTLTLESWFGNEGILFGLQRFKFDFEVPLTSTITVFTKAQWDFSDTPPLDWFDVGWSISF